MGTSGSRCIETSHHLCAREKDIRLCCLRRRFVCGLIFRVLKLCVEEVQRDVSSARDDMSNMENIKES